MIDAHELSLIKTALLQQIIKEYDFYICSGDMDAFLKAQDYNELFKKLVENDNQ